MHCALISAALAATASAHGLVTKIRGANGVIMPGLSAARDIRSGNGSPLGRTQSNGPVDAAVDPSSGGTDASAFQNAQITQNIPGLGISRLSLANNTDFPMVKIPPGILCDGKVGSATHVCIVRVANGAAAGPFGGSAAFTQTPAAGKRAVAYRLSKRMEIKRR
ncbi:hypothetical protein E4U21_001405 [Claviceps maximensis]|nr:hypothetical protein E4U21_001405 [Claviceps maximensis]